MLRRAVALVPGVDHLDGIAVELGDVVDHGIREGAQHDHLVVLDALFGSEVGEVEHQFSSSR